MGSSKRDGYLAEKRRYWGGHVSSWVESGLSQAEYCRRHGLAATRLGDWVRRLGATSSAKGVSTEAAVELVEVNWPGPASRSLGSELASLRVVIGDRYTIEVDGDFDQMVLEKLATSLDRLC